MDTVEVKPRLVNEIPLPEQVETAFLNVLRLRGMSASKQLLELEEFKLRYAYGGLLAVCEKTPEGRCIHAIGEGDEPEFQAALVRMHEEYETSGSSSRFEAFNIPALDD